MSQLEKKYNKNKKYIKDLEKELIKKDEKIKEMKKQKKNDDLCSQLESTVSGMGNELGEIEFGGSGTSKNMLNSKGDMDVNIEPEMDAGANEDGPIDHLEDRRNSLTAFESGDFQNLGTGYNDGEQMMYQEGDAIYNDIDKFDQVNDLATFEQENEGFPVDMADAPFQEQAEPNQEDYENLGGVDVQIDCVDLDEVESPVKIIEEKIMVDQDT